MSTRVLIVDDHAMFRAGVRAELGASVDVVAEAADVDEAVAAVVKHRPDVVLLDLMLPDRPGTEVCRVLRANPITRTVPVIMVTVLAFCCPAVWRVELP